MKTIFAVLAVLLNITFISAQNKFTDFNLQKKSRDLRTGICMSYIDTGSRNGTPVLLLHGYTDTSRSFQLVIEELLDINKNIRIIAPDLRGHGQSSMPDSDECRYAPESCFSQEQFAEDVFDLLDQLSIKNAHIVGHSMGSIIAQTMALTSPDRVTSMTLIGTFVDGKESATIDFLLEDLVEKDWRCILEEQHHAQWPSDAYSFLPLNMGDRVINFLKENWVVESGACKEFLAAILPETIRVPLGTWIGVIKGLDKVDHQDALKKLTTPTLILWGIQDVLTDAADQQKVKSAFRSAAESSGTKVYYKVYGEDALKKGASQTGAGHNLHWVAHKAVARDIADFIVNGNACDAVPIASFERSNTMQSGARALLKY